MIFSLFFFFLLNPFHVTKVCTFTPRETSKGDWYIEKPVSKPTCVGERGITHLQRQGELLGACLAMSHAGSVLITTGFPTHFTHQPPEENDGPPGALAIAAMLQALEKQVAIVTDQRAMDLNKKIIEEAVKLGKRYGVIILLICAKVCFSFNLSLSTGIFPPRELIRIHPVSSGHHCYNAILLTQLASSWCLHIWVLILDWVACDKFYMSWGKPFLPQGLI